MFPLDESSSRYKLFWQEYLLVFGYKEFGNCSWAIFPKGSGICQVTKYLFIFSLPISTLIASGHSPISLETAWGTGCDPSPLIQVLGSKTTPCVYISSLPCGQGNCQAQGPEFRNVAHVAPVGGLQIQSYRWLGENDLFQSRTQWTG